LFQEKKKTQFVWWGEGDGAVEKEAISRREGEREKDRVWGGEEVNREGEVVGEGEVDRGEGEVIGEGGGEGEVDRGEGEVIGGEGEVTEEKEGKGKVSGVGRGKKTEEKRNRQA
jgi:hypothetical protein